MWGLSVWMYGEDTGKVRERYGKDTAEAASLLEEDAGRSKSVQKGENQRKLYGQH